MNIKTSISLVLALSITTAAKAQEQTIIVKATAAAAGAGIVVSSPLTLGQSLVFFQGDGQVVRSSGSYGYWGGYSPEYLLAMKQIHEELGLIDEQVKKLLAIKTEGIKKRQELYKAMNDIALEKRAEFYWEMYAVDRENMEKAIDEVLLPHQKKRLDQIQHQMTIKTQGSYALRNPKLAEALGITPEQFKEMQEKAAEANRKLAADYQRMRKEAQEKILSDVLTKEQQKLLENLSGKTFEFKPVNRNFRVLDNPARSKKEPENK